MDEFGESYESDSSFDSGMDLGGSESFESFDSPDTSFTESEPLSEGFDEAPLEDYSAGSEDLSFDETPALEDYSSETSELPFDETPLLEDYTSDTAELPFNESPELEDYSSDADELSFDEAAPLDDYSSNTEDLPFDELSPLEDPDVVPNDISEELDTLDAIEDDPSAVLDKAPEEDLSYFEDASLEDNATSETTEVSEEFPIDETVPEGDEISETTDDFEELPLDETVPESDYIPETSDSSEELSLDETVPESDEIPETTDSFEEPSFDESNVSFEMSESPEMSDATEETTVPEALEPAEDGGIEDYDYETAPETMDNQNPETIGEFAPTDNPYGETWEQFSEENPDAVEQSSDWDSLQEVPFAGEDDPEGVVEPKAYESVSDYMNAHNYGQEDFETYSQDPEWRELMRNEYPDYELPELSQESAQEQLNQYMSDHNYGIEDYDEYSQDPTWRELHSTVFPDDELPPLNIENTETVEPSFDDSTNLESPEAVSDVPESVPESIEETTEASEFEEPAERIYNDFEQSVIETNPEFYDSGEFLEQGVNKHGFEGTCGETTQANTLNKLLGTNEFTEDKVLDVALDNDLCFSEGDPASCGGTTTEQFMDLYDKMNEQLDCTISTELYEYDDALGVEEVAQQLENGNVVNVAVDSNALWGYSDYVDEMGVPIDDVVSDHWITVTGVERNDLGEIEGFNILDSGGGENYVSAEKYHDICFGTDEHKVLDPTTIVVSKVEDANG